MSRPAAESTALAATTSSAAGTAAASPPSSSASSRDGLAPRDFPAGFGFGAATSAYQVEGGIENDWSHWERQGRTRTPCGRAIDHWNRYGEDFDLLAQSGLSVYRMSVEWARIEPEPGRFDELALERYRAMLQKLRALGVRPMVTLHHFTHPAWFHAKTPWHSPASLDVFLRFVRRVAERLEGLVDSYVTFNEPMVLLLGGYVDAQIPPGHKDLTLFTRACANMLRAHIACRGLLSELAPGVPVGISHNVMEFGPLRAWNPVDRTIASFSRDLYNHAIPRAFVDGRLQLRMPMLLNHREIIDGARGSLDFLGINYYSRIHVGMKLGKPFVQARYLDVEQRGTTDLGWEWYPEGFAAVLTRMREYDLPIWITENGIADASGDKRVQFLRDHLGAVRDQIRDGADIRGYLHWSLLDNFEWLEGLGPRFGLYRVNFDTLERAPTPAVEWLKGVAATGRLVPP